MALWLYRLADGRFSEKSTLVDYLENLAETTVWRSLAAES
jgi:hypothetical protein